MHRKKTVLKIFSSTASVFAFCTLSFCIHDYLHGIDFFESLQSPRFYFTPFVVASIIIAIFFSFWRDREKKLFAINRYSYNLKALLDVNSSFISTINLNELLQIIVEQATMFNKLETGAIYLLKDKNLYLAATTPPLPEGFAEEFRHDYVANHPHLQKSLNDNQALYIPDVSKVKLSDSETKIITQRQLKTLLYIPLIVEQRHVGVLILGTVTETRKLSDSEIEMCNAFSGEAALAIENARLFNDIEEYARKLEIQNTEIKRINDALNDNNKKINLINEELTIAKKTAEESDRLKTAFLNNLSHEIRTPLNAVVGFANLIAVDSNPIERISDYSNAIVSCSDRLLEVISDIIITSQIHTGQIKMFYSEFNIYRLIETTCNKLQQIASEKGVRFEVNNLNIPVEYKIVSDINKVEKIIYHIATNAIKFTHKGTVNLFFDIQDNKFVFKCIDNGIGIDKQYQDIIFEPFRQIKNIDSADFEGNGLGLSITKAYVKLLNGAINLSSVPEKGTSVTINIPLVKA